MTEIELIEKLSCKKWSDLNISEKKLISDFEQKAVAERYIEYPDTYEPQIFNINENINDYYIDQSPRFIGAYGFSISSIYTTMGIKKIDKWFSEQIRNSLIEKSKLEKLIKRNPHLSNVIKTNLLSNLENNY